MIRLLLMAYSARWRARYGEELVALLEDTGLSWRAALDVLVSGARQRAASIDLQTGGSEMIFGTASRHASRLALLSLLILTPTLLLAVGSVFAYQLGADGLRPIMDSVNRFLAGASLLDVFLVSAPAIAVALAVAPLVRLEVGNAAGGREVVVGIRLRAVNVAVVLVGVAISALLTWHLLAELTA